MLLQAPDRRAREAMVIFRRKLKRESMASCGIWAEITPRGFGFFGVIDSGRTAVEINVPPLKKRPMGLVAQEGKKLFLCHNGRLNPRLLISQPEVFAQMRNSLRDVKRANGIVEQCVVVAGLNDSSEKVAGHLSNFVKVCQRLTEAAPEKLSIQDLKRLALRNGQKKPKKRIVDIAQYERCLHVRALAKRLANGLCDLCREPAPFKTSDGPFLECHHIIHLSDGGPDVIENTVALCPNCHRRMHQLNLAEDRAKLKRHLQVREI
jgi:5-methylcytosine-specific restriction endonuclease McrA